MKDIYVLVKPEEVELANTAITLELRATANIHVITDVNEIPPDKRKKLVVETHYEDMIEYKMPEIDEIDYKKLAVIDRKEKNMTRQRIEKEALKYRNRHFKK